MAIVFLAVSVVALGAAAKHSQFPSSAHHATYLAQAVKMVSDGDAPPTFALAPAAHDSSVHAFIFARQPQPSVEKIPLTLVPSATPLLI